MKRDPIDERCDFVDDPPCDVKELLKMQKNHRILSISCGYLKEFYFTCGLDGTAKLSKYPLK